jgi:hypothetical protein
MKKSLILVIACIVIIIAVLSVFKAIDRTIKEKESIVELAEPVESVEENICVPMPTYAEEYITFEQFKEFVKISGYDVIWYDALNPNNSYSNRYKNYKVILKMYDTLHGLLISHFSDTQGAIKRFNHFHIKYGDDITFELVTELVTDTAILTSQYANLENQ